MNFWATIEHSLNYKYKGAIPEDLKMRLKHPAETAHLLDQKIPKIREKIQKIQRLTESIRKIREELDDDFKWY
jgi:putative GTP pyrophosphokinase